jgi:Protein of unknown function (DUF1488)
MLRPEKMKRQAHTTQDSGEARPKRQANTLRQGFENGDSEQPRQRLVTSTYRCGTMKIPLEWSIAMPLQRGEVQGYDFDRMTVEFTMLNQGKVIICAISTAAMDNIEDMRDVRPDQRLDQFMRLRDVIEERASRKFFEEQVQADRPVVLRSNDFIR